MNSFDAYKLRLSIAPNRRIDLENRDTEIELDRNYSLLY